MIALSNSEYDKGENMKRLVDEPSLTRSPSSKESNQTGTTMEKFKEDLKRAEKVAIDTSVNELLEQVGIAPPKDASSEEIERVKSAVAALSLELNIGEAEILSQEKKYVRSIYLTSAVTNELIAERQIEITWAETVETREEEESSNEVN
ncbi:hypothetical protein [Bacillus phage phiAGATE]|uniref:Uncharacterized protein n=1 Tax=Bacillus phage phiAGATE TaxID=1204533 RepID=L0LAH9_9CAUD|nr:hypothetical protein G380_gp102 [Bacillus phage phiAGATE]AGB62752.1 hypothetical protein [Bacillus phage phiAGATE]